MADHYLECTVEPNSPTPACVALRELVAQAGGRPIALLLPLAGGGVRFVIHSIPDGDELGAVIGGMNSLGILISGMGEMP